MHKITHKSFYETELIHQNCIDGYFRAGNALHFIGKAHFRVPAGKMEENFKAVSEGVTKNMTEQQRAEFRKAHGFEVVGPALGYLKQ
jgi:hypothetical protein